MKRNILFFVVTLLLSESGYSNVAQPGVWSSGGAGNYTLLFPGDSLYYKSIQMVREKVLIQLYPGFAVVKGTYWMLNTEDDTISINAGYPVNSCFSPPINQLTNIFFDGLYCMKVFSDGQKCSYSRNSLPDLQFGSQDWYTWENTFIPHVLTKIEIYFLVNTNNSSMKDGYSDEDDNVFVYLLESGASWKPPIGEGEFLIQLMDGVERDDIRGASPQDIFKIDPTNKILLYTFKDLIPEKGDNNIVIAYGELIPNFNFASITPLSEVYFEKIDNMEKLEVEKLGFAKCQFDNPFSFGSEFNNPMIILLGIGFVVVAIIIGLVIFLVIRLT